MYHDTNEKIENMKEAGIERMLKKRRAKIKRREKEEEDMREMKLKKLREESIV
jgi:hypothetical protein